MDSTFYTTVSVVRTMEELLGLPPMNNNDAFAPPIASLFTGAGDQPPYEADYRNRDNGLMYQANSPKAPGAQASSRMDFNHEDRADPRVLNVILWRDAMGNKPVPAMLAHLRAGGSRTMTTIGTLSSKSVLRFTGDRRCTVSVGFPRSEYPSEPAMRLP